ncbi:MAG: YjbQ family protein [Deltaproteobacteria bacterium]|nr:YjbQ family protein [Deltaproteobacteria bacterium]
MSFKEINLITSQRTEMVDITHRVSTIISDLNVSNGIVTVFSQHTTAAITINENADPSVKNDMLKSLNKLIPFDDSYSHLEGNSAAHIKTTLTGLSVTIPIENGKMALGIWQGIYFCEFDGPRKRKFSIKIIRD